MTSPEPSDADLIRRAQKGDRSGMDELVVRYRQRAFQYAYRLSSNADDASDLVAEAFMRAYSAMARFRGDSRFSTWLYRIITNCFLDWKKREATRRHQSIDDLHTDPSTEGSSEAPDEVSERLERQRLMQDAVGKLPDYQRAMIVMYHAEMLSYDEIAEALDMPIGTVKSRLNRARLALREILEPYEELFRR